VAEWFVVLPGDVVEAVALVQCDQLEHGAHPVDLAGEQWPNTYFAGWSYRSRVGPNWGCRGRWGCFGGRVPVAVFPFGPSGRGVRLGWRREGSRWREGAQRGGRRGR
jgi:hypothetical protein